MKRIYLVLLAIVTTLVCCNKTTDTHMGLTKNAQELQSVAQFIQKHQFFCVMGHFTPDLDSLCSQMALASLLQSLGKEAVLISAGPFSNANVKPYAALFQSDLPLERLKQKDAAIIFTDCANFKRTGFHSLECPAMVIDHHAGRVGDDITGLVDPNSPSTTVLIYRLMKWMKHKITPAEAELLVLGFCHDTMCFRQYLEGDWVPFVQDIMELVTTYKISLQDMCLIMDGQYSMASRLYLGELLSKAQSYAQGQVVMVVSDKPGVHLDKDEYNNIFRLLLNVDTVKIAILMHRSTTGPGFDVELRCHEGLDVAKMAVQQGGGGHVKASGFPTDMSPQAVKDFVLQEMAKQLNG